MASKKINHNKKRNTGLLYEFLIQHIYNCLAENKKNKASKVVSLVKKYFGKGKCLNEELKLFKTILDAKMSSAKSAHELLQEIVTRAKNIDPNKLNEEKTKLIKEINYSLESDKIYKYRITNYPIYASVGILLSNVRAKKNIIEGVDRIKIEDSLVRYLTENKEENKVNLDPAYSNAVYKIAVKKFHEKYKNLSESQKKIITDYSISLISNDKNKFQNVINEQVENIKSKLRVIKDSSLKEDVELSKKINECYKKFVSKNFSNIDREKVVDLLQYMSLVQEMDSDE